MKVTLLFAFLALASAELHPLSDEFLQVLQSKTTTWKAGRNFHKDTPLEFLKGLNGVLPSPKGPKPNRRIGSVPKGFDIPENFDAREQWPDCPTIKEIRDQGSCGSCWAVAAVSAMSDRACIHSGGKANFRYSSENLVACCSSCGFGCNGGWLGPSFDYWVETGIVSGGPYGSNEGCQPYSIRPTGYEKMLRSPNEPTPPCKHECQAEYDLEYEEDLRFAKDAYMISENEDEIKYEIMTNGPVEVSFDVYEDFYSYTSGVYQHVFGGYVGGHAVKMLGWGEEDGTPYWIIANSWNVSWGENGFFKMLRGSNECNIESDVHGGTPKPL